MSATAGALVLAGRILFTMFFLIAALTLHLGKPGQAAAYARSARFPFPAIAGGSTGLWLLASVISIVLGIWPDLGAIGIMVFVLLAAAWFHRFWAVPDEQQKMVQMQLFWRNVGISFGAALMMFGLFITVGEQLRFTITPPLFSF